MQYIYVLNIYLEMLNKWKLQDTWLEKSKNDIAMTISNQAFISSKKAITNLIAGVFQPPKQIRGKYQSTFLIQAFSHFGFLANTCCKYGEKFPEIKLILLNSLKKLLGSIFTHILSELEETELDLEQSIALSQTNGMEEFRKFISTYCGYTQMKAKDVRHKINEDYFDRCIIKLEGFGFENFIKNLKNSFISMLEIYAKGIFTFDVSYFLNDFLHEYEDLINSADSDQQEIIMSSLVRIFEQKYFLNLCNQSYIISKRNIDLLLDRIEADSDIVKTFFQLYLGDEMSTTNKLFDELDLFIRADSYDSTVICILNFQSLFPEIINLDIIKKMLKLKVHFRRIEIKKLNEEFSLFFARKESRSLVNQNLKMIVGISSPVVYEFVKVLKDIYEKAQKYKIFLENKKKKFAFMYEEDAYQRMLTQDEEKKSSGINAGLSSIPTKDEAIDSMRDVKVVITMEDKINNEWGNKIFNLEKFILPAINDWSLIEDKFKTLKRENKSNSSVYVKFDQDVLQTSKDFFGQKGVSVYNYRIMENLRKVGSHGFSFTIGQRCYGFLLSRPKSERNRTKQSDAENFLTLIQNRMDNLEKDVYEGVNLYRLQELDLSQKLGEFHLEIKEEPYVFNYSKEKENMLREGHMKIGNGRKKSVELPEEDFF
jgi:hypothetical protein